MSFIDIKEIMNTKPQMRDKLFSRGFYFTDGTVNEDDYPFYGLWNKEKFGKYTLMVSPKQSFYTQNICDGGVILVGHAYNPFKMEANESEILRTLAAKTNCSDFWSEFNQLTGIFTLIVYQGDKVFFVGDPTCMQNTFYCQEQGHIYISSHTNLIGDLLNLEWDSYVRMLVSYKFFKLLGNSLPGDITQFANVKRLVPNHYMEFSNGNYKAVRFYWPAKLQISKEEVVNQVSDIMHSNLELISEKWEKPSISMTGGCDSKTTLACAKGLYDRFSYFSYISSEAEQVDAEAAQKICSAISQKHKTYTVSQNDSDYDDIEEIRAILFWNCGGIRQSNRNDVRKRCMFLDTQDFDVEVKSWASEIGRAYYSKRFHNRKVFGMPTPRKCTTLYKFFLHNRALVHKTDEVFAKYLDLFFEQAKENPIEWQEQFFWEFRVPSWNGLVITGEHRTSFDITIPYNNRLLLERLLSVSLDDRIKDTIYREIREKMNPAIDATNIAVTNLKHTQIRAVAENIYYILHSRL